MSSTYTCIGTTTQLFSSSSHRPQQHKLYFIASFIAYIVGLVSTVVVMYVFKAAQPALLYLVPCCVGLPLLLALVRGEIMPLLK